MRPIRLTLLSLLFAISACGGGDNSTSPDEDSTSTEASASDDTASASDDTASADGTTSTEASASDDTASASDDSDSDGGLGSRVVGSDDGDTSNTTVGDDSDDADDETAGTTTTEVVEEELDVFEISVGDCFNDFSEGQIETVTGRSCDAEHLYEVYHAFDIPGDDYPGEDDVVTAAQDGCLAEFEAFVGLEYQSSALDISYLYPTTRSWALGDDREVLCMVVNVDETARVGTARGSAE